MKALESCSGEEGEAICRCFAGNLSVQDLEFLLDLYARFDGVRADDPSVASAREHANALSRAIARTARPEFVPQIRRAVLKMPFTSSARWVVLALLSHGSVGDVDMVLRRIAEADERIEFENHTSIGQAVARGMMAIASGVPAFLLKAMSRREFWHYRGKDSTTSDDSLGLKATENRALYIRIAAYAAIGAVGTTELEVLFRLVLHSYGLIARAAVIRLVRMLGADAFKQIFERFKGGLSSSEATSLAESLRDAEIEHYDLANMW